MREVATTAAYDWFPRVADELELLDAGVRSWRSRSADRLRALACGTAEIVGEDGDLLGMVAAELAGEEDKGALDAGLVTWRTLAADELAELAIALRDGTRIGQAVGSTRC